MKIFIAGATGVLGRRVIPGLISSNHRVVGLSRSDQNDLILHQLGAEPCRGDLFDVDDAAAAVVQAVSNSVNNKGKTFNICDDMPVLYKDVILFIAKKLKARKPGTVSVEDAKQVLGSGMIEYLLTSYRCSNKRAKKELGWQPVYENYKAGYTHELNNWLSNSI